MRKFFLFAFFIPAFLNFGNIYAQQITPQGDNGERNANQEIFGRNFDYKLEAGFSLFQPNTSEVNFSDDIEFTDYKGKIIFDSYFLRFRGGYLYNFEIWLTYQRLRYERNEREAKQTNGTVVDEDGEIAFQTYLIELPIFFSDPNEVFNANFAIGIGAAKAEYNVDQDSGNLNGNEYMRVLNFSAGLHLKAFPEADLAIYYNYEVLETAESKSFSIQNIMFAINF